jgi:hypothetical protein
MRGTQAKRLRRLALTTCESAGIKGSTYQMENMHDIPVHGVFKGMRVVIGWWRWGIRKAKGVHGVYKQFKKHFKREKAR